MSKEKRKFNKEVGDFVTTIIIMTVINMMVSPGYFWTIWVIGFWGAALLGKYIKMQLDNDIDDNNQDYLELDDAYEYQNTSRKSWKEKDLV